MTKGLEDLLNLPPLEAAPTDQNLPSAPVPGNLPLTEKDAADHASAMDHVHDEAIKTGADMIELAYNLDPARSPRMFEVAAQYMKMALDAKNSKMDVKLKIAKFIQDEKKLKADLGEQPSEKADIVVVESRTELLRRWREEDKNKDK